MKIGFIGLGAMGMPMARNLLKGGHDLTAWNWTPATAKALEPEGARIAAHPGETCDGDALISVLSDDQAIEDVFFGESRLVSRLRPATIHVSMGTISPAMAGKLAEAHSQAGNLYVSAPVFGRPEAAAVAQLLIVAAGPYGAIDRCRPVFSALGSKTLSLGEDPRAANAFKLAGNFLIASVLESLGEAFALLRKSGVEPRVFLEAMTAGLFASPVYKNYGALILEEKFQPAGFSVRLALKDIRLVLAAAEAAAVPMPIANVVRDHLLTAMAHGRQGYDWSSLANVAAENAGL